MNDIPDWALALLFGIWRMCIFTQQDKTEEEVIQAFAAFMRGRNAWNPNESGRASLARLRAALEEKHGQNPNPPADDAATAEPATRLHADNSDLG